MKNLTSFKFLTSKCLIKKFYSNLVLELLQKHIIKLEREAENPKTLVQRTEVT